MNWISLIGAIGVGAIIVKILDIVWLQKMIQSNQKTSWLREKRLKSFTELSKDLLSFGLHKNKQSSVFEDFALMAEATLVIEDDNLIKKMDKFIVDRNKLNTLSDEGNHKEADKLYKMLCDESRSIVKQLRNLIIENDRKNGWCKNIFKRKK